MSWVQGAILDDPAAILLQSPFRILVVEDEDIHFAYCQGMLEAIFGDRLALDRATACTEAVDKLSAGHHDICLLDYLVEDGNARDILSRVNFGLVHTPVIIVSAYEDKTFILDALRFGADDYVVKGRFTRAHLEQVIQYAVYRKHKELLLRKQALYDPLTGLANRYLLMDRLEELHRFSVRYGEKYAVVAIDADRLKTANDVYGHDAGDRYLLGIAHALTGAVRTSDTVARMGGDEFLAVVKNIHEKANMERVCTAIRDGVGRFSLGDGIDFRPSCSVGAAVYPDDGASPADLIAKADAAMYVAKRAGGGGWRLAE